MAQELPLHLAQLVKDLASEATEPALLKRRPLLQCDLSLRKAFSTLGFAAETGQFEREVSAKEAIEAIRKACEEGVRERESEVEDMAVDLSVSPGFELAWGKPCATPLFPKGDMESLPSCTPLLERGDSALSALWSPGSSQVPKPCISSFSPCLHTPTTKPSSSLPSFSPDCPLFRSCRGLKALSGKVFSLLRHAEVCSYKDVADRLLLESVWSAERVMEEKNVRRRVYDAINVLVAAEVLKKVGKVVKVARVPIVNSGLDLRIAAKTATLVKLMEQRHGLQALLVRNQTIPCSWRWHPPLWLVSSRKSVTIQANRGELLVKSASKLHLRGEEVLSQVVCSPLEPLRDASDLATRCAQLLACPL